MSSNNKEYDNKNIIEKSFNINNCGLILNFHVSVSSSHEDYESIVDNMNIQIKNFSNWLTSIEEQPSNSIFYKNLIEEMIFIFNSEIIFFNINNNTPKFSSWLSEEIKNRKNLAFRTAKSKTETEKIEKGNKILSESGYNLFPSLFKKARNMKRKLLFFAGPTNSGKTYEALEIAKKANKAEILSPLRLLALEHYELLKDFGLDAGLITGEEQQGNYINGTHIARTIETANFNNEVDVVVIDEIQMLNDNTRGWAWTNALLGSPAKLIIMTGSESAIPLVKKIASMTNEELEIKVFDRKNKLNVLDKNVKYEDIKKGDAIIVFSRKDVHAVKEYIVNNTNYKVSVIYGALGPEVRKQEASRFRNGETDIIVATDAIGMGLNLGPINRVLFYSLYKYDGVNNRILNDSEIKQISGRAGRFGVFDCGYVGLLEEAGNPLKLVSAIKSKNNTISSYVYIRPSFEVVKITSEILQTENLFNIYNYLGKYLIVDHPEFKMTKMNDMKEIASICDLYNIPFNLKYTFSCLPADIRDNSIRTDLIKYIQFQKNNIKVPYDMDIIINNNLKDMETLYKKTNLYLWLSNRYPDIYYEGELAKSNNTLINKKIEELLILSVSVKEIKNKSSKSKNLYNDDYMYEKELFGIDLYS